MAKYRSRATFDGFNLGEDRASLPTILVIDIGDGWFNSIPASRFAPDVWLVETGEFFGRPTYRVLGEDEFHKLYEPVEAK